MDVLDEGKIHSQVVDPALARLADETIPALEKAVAQQVEHAAEELETIIGKALIDIGARAVAFTNDIEGIVASLDGWTVEIGPITIPPISIRLSKPKEQK